MFTAGKNEGGCYKYPLYGVGGDVITNIVDIVYNIVIFILYEQ
jgi:hypothetical protein